MNNTDQKYNFNNVFFKQKKRINDKIFTYLLIHSKLVEQKEHAKKAAHTQI